MHCSPKLAQKSPKKSVSSGGRCRPSSPKRSRTWASSLFLAGDASPLCVSNWDDVEVCTIRNMPAPTAIPLMVDHCAAWIQERLDTVYRPDPRYTDKAQSLFVLDLGAPEVSPLPIRYTMFVTHAFSAPYMHQAANNIRCLMHGQPIFSHIELRVAV
jgi:hypothetical protein